MGLGLEGLVSGWTHRSGREIQKHKALDGCVRQAGRQTQGGGRRGSTSHFFISSRTMSIPFGFDLSGFVLSNTDWNAGYKAKIVGSQCEIVDPRQGIAADTFSSSFLGRVGPLPAMFGGKNEGTYFLPFLLLLLPAEAVGHKARH